MKVLPCRKGSRFCERCALSEQVSSFPFGHFGRGKSAQYKYLNRVDYIITYRFPSPVGCVSPPTVSDGPEEAPLPDRAPAQSPLRAARSGVRPAKVRPLPGRVLQGPFPKGRAPIRRPAPGRPTQGNPHREIHIWEAPTGLLGLSAEGAEEGSPASPPPNPYGRLHSQEGWR